MPLWKENPAARNRIEILLCYPGVHALICHRVLMRFIIMASSCWHVLYLNFQIFYRLLRSIRVQNRNGLLY